MNKNDILKGLEIRALSSEGQGIAKPDGYTVFVKDTLPGDIVTVKVMKVKKNTAFARLVSIDEMSSDRVQSRCTMARPCGGCAVQELDYDKQLAFKDEKVYNCLLEDQISKYQLYIESSMKLHNVSNLYPMPQTVAIRHEA